MENTLKTTTNPLRTAQQNAAEFGALTKQGKDMRLALLVACSVERGVGGRGNTGVSQSRNSTKLSGAEFAKQAGTSADRVLRHLTAWNKFAKLTGLPVAADLTPNEAVTLDITEEQAEVFANEIDLDSKNGGGGSQKAKDIASNTGAMGEAIKSNSKVAAAAAAALAQVSPEALADLVAANPEVAEAVVATKSGRRAVRKGVQRVSEKARAKTRMPKRKDIVEETDQPLTKLELESMQLQFEVIAGDAADVRTALDIVQKMRPYLNDEFRYNLAAAAAKASEAWELMRGLIMSEGVTDAALHDLIEQTQGGN